MLLLLLMLSSPLSTNASSVVHVNAISGNDEKCLATFNSTATSIPCCTLERAYDLLHGKSNFRIVLQTDVDLHQLLLFHGICDATIQGYHHTLNTLNNTDSLTKRVNCHNNSGLNIIGCTSFSLSHLEFINCNGQDDETHFNSSIILKSSTEINFTNIRVINSSSSAIIIYDCYGPVQMENVSLENNGRHGSCPSKSGGLTIEIKTSTNVGHYFLKNCIFQNNRNSNTKYCSKVDNDIHWDNAKMGGGMSIIIVGNCSNNTIIILGSNFSGNHADWGAGLYVQIQNSIQFNRIFVYHSKFHHNKARYLGGGAGLCYAATNSATNHIHFNDVEFKSNHAGNGGGVGVQLGYSTSNFDERNIVFRNCTWTSNTARLLSPAIDIAKYKMVKREGFLPSLLFQDVNIIGNQIEIEYARKFKSTYHKIAGVVVITETTVYFSGNVNFVDNKFSALQAISGQIVFLNNTITTFLHNFGINGAAIAMYGFSNLHLKNNIVFNFTNNEASNYGGAIYYNGIDQRDFFGGTNCFIEVHNKAPHNNVTFYFEGNKALKGTWIYADSFLSCKYYCSNEDAEDIDNGTTIESVTKCIGDFRPKPNEQDLITSSARRFNTQEDSYSTFPGGHFRLNMTVTDDFNQPIQPLLKLSIPDADSHNIKITENYALFPEIHPVGLPREKACIEVSVMGIRNIFFRFNLTMLPCPPGFVYDSISSKCICGNNETTGKYSAIVQCNTKLFQASMDRKYWAGYIPYTTNNTFSDLYFAPCYPPICSVNITALLPTKPKTLNEFICRNTNRKGIMCGQCRDNHTVYFHSNLFLCKPNRNCKLGPLLYICSELLPVLVLFFVVVMCDLSFTSGKVVGFIFVCQYLGGVNLLVHPNLILPSRLLYGIFNLELLTNEHLSFCLWESLEMQDIIAFKYITILFAFALVVLQITVLKTNRCIILCKIRNQFSNKNSFIRGLSAFLVICYIQCTKTSFQLLQYAHPEGLNGKKSQVYTYYGGQPYFQGKHFRYCIIAIFTLVMVTILPPFFLLFHPLMLNILSLCKLSEHWLILKIYGLLQIQKLMPFIDCFQGCYKDRFRFFAGLYFVYRVAIIVCVLTAKSYSEVLVFTQLLLVLIFVIHSVLNPYKLKLHNSLDSAAISIMALINIINIIVDRTPSVHQWTIYLLQAFQLILLYLPIVASTILLGKEAYKKFYRSRHYYAVLDDDITDRQEEENLITHQSSQEQTEKSVLHNYTK